MHTLLCSDVIKKKFYLGPSIILFSEDIKLWMIYWYTLEIFVLLQLKNSMLMFWNKKMKLCPFAISQQLYTLLDRKKQTFYVNSYDFTLLLFVGFDICWYITLISCTIRHTYIEVKRHSTTRQQKHTAGAEE
jgi:hypothetical protein